MQQRCEIFGPGALSLVGKEPSWTVAINTFRPWWPYFCKFSHFPVFMEHFSEPPETSTSTATNPNAQNMKHET